MLDSNFPLEYFSRVDESDDEFFYAQPRKVVHIDDNAIDTVSAVFRDFIPVDSVVLDFMSSWKSHWPQDHLKRRLVGLGLNSEEMIDNLDLDEHIVQDVNQDPRLPFHDNLFDAVVITVSVQYLTKPIDIFRELNRVMKENGVLVVSFSNRMFATKAVNIWRNTDDNGHLDLVSSYMQYAEGFKDIKGGLANAQSSPPNNPLFVVMGTKNTNPSDFES
jgi:SAM-dependent methyltransferase